LYQGRPNSYPLRTDALKTRENREAELYCVGSDFLQPVVMYTMFGTA